MTSSKNFQIEWFCKPEAGRNDAVWYYGAGLMGTATLTDNGKTYSLNIYCDGETRVDVPYVNDDGTIDGNNYQVVRYVDQWQGIGVTNDTEMQALTEKWNALGYDIWTHNSWFDFYTPDGEHLDCVTHEIPDVIEQAEAVLRQLAAEAS